MYARSYFQGDADISVPENYDGTVFLNEVMQAEAKPPRIEPIKSETKFSPKDESTARDPGTNPECEECSAKPQARGGIFGVDLKGIFSSVFSTSRLGSFLPKDFGFEEILIIGIALFLLFSPERDIECALLLLALVFIR